MNSNTLFSNAISKAIGITLALSMYGSAESSAAASRDWIKYPAVVQVDTPEEIFAIGDPHE